MPGLPGMPGPEGNPGYSGVKGMKGEPGHGTKGIKVHIWHFVFSNYSRNNIFKLWKRITNLQNLEKNKQIIH